MRVKADIRTPLRSMLMNRRPLCGLLSGALTPTEESVPLDPRLRLCGLEAGD